MFLLLSTSQTKCHFHWLTVLWAKRISKRSVFKDSLVNAFQFLLLTDFAVEGGLLSLLYIARNITVVRQKVTTYRVGDLEKVIILPRNYQVQRMTIQVCWRFDMLFESK